MLELRFVRENLQLVQKKCELRGMNPDLLDRFVQIDGKRLRYLGEVEALKNKRNTA